MSNKAKKDEPAGPAGMDALGRPYEIDPGTLDRSDVNDQKVLDQKKKEQTARRRADDLVIQMIMDRPDGRDWMYRKLAACHIFDVGCDLGSMNRNADALLTYFMCGERNIGNQLLTDLQRAAPAQYLQMISEQNTKKAVRDE